MDRVGVLVIAVVVLSLSGVLSVIYIAVRLNSISDKAFFLSVITAFIAPTVVSLLAILRGEVASREFNGRIDGLERRTERRKTNRK